MTQKLFISQLSSRSVNNHTAWTIQQNNLSLFFPSVLLHVTDGLITMYQTDVKWIVSLKEAQIEICEPETVTVVVDQWPTLLGSTQVVKNVFSRVQWLTRVFFEPVQVSGFAAYQGRRLKSWSLNRNDWKWHVPWRSKLNKLQITPCGILCTT
jgi:hypothetical protein